MPLFLLKPELSFAVQSVLILEPLWVFEQWWVEEFPSESPLFSANEPSEASSFWVQPFFAELDSPKDGD